MELKEIALQLTIKALDKGDISLKPPSKASSSPEQDREATNGINARLISDFYNNLLKHLIENASE